MVHIIFPILIFFLGASIGSFLSVAIYRIQKNKPGIIFGHSFCPSCKKRLTIRDLVPILSYIMLRGKCRFCKKSFSPHYLFLEAITGLVFLALYFRFPFMEFATMENLSMSIGLFIPFVLYSLYSSFFVAIFFYDLQTKKIPDVFLFPLLAFTIIGSLILGTPDLWSMAIAVIIALIFFGGQILISKGTWLGEGDLYLALSIAIIFGWKLFLVSIILSYFIGASLSIILLATKQVKKKTTIAFAPFLIMGAVIALFFGNDILSIYLSTMTL